MGFYNLVAEPNAGRQVVAYEIGSPIPRSRAHFLTTYQLF